MKPAVVKHTQEAKFPIVEGAYIRLTRTKTPSMPDPVVSAFFHTQYGLSFNTPSGLHPLISALIACQDQWNTWLTEDWNPE